LTSHPLDQPLTSIEAAHPGCAEPGLPLTAGVRITQTFQAHHPGLNRVDVEFVRTSDPSAEPVRFLLWRDREEGDLVADITVDGEALCERGLGVFFFAPVADSAGQTFVWAMEAPEAGDEPPVVVCQAEGGPAFTAYSVQLQLADIRQGVWLYENPNALPRAYVVHRAEVVSDRDLLNRLISPDFNPWTTALLEEPLPAGEASALAGAPLRSSSMARITRYEPHRVKVEAEMAAPGLLILSDTYYPGWKVTVDGLPAPLLRVNYALRGVYLLAGTHHVDFYFAPIFFYVGLMLTGATLISGSGFILWKVGRVWARERRDSCPRASGKILQTRR
jgi:hypothetical protein